MREPELKPIERRQLHKELWDILIAKKYQGFVPIEMEKTENLMNIENVMCYLKEIFGNKDSIGDVPHFIGNILTVPAMVHPLKMNYNRFLCNLWFK